MSGSPRRIYLDNAATSFPKPESVYAAVDDYQRQSGVAVGRGAYSQAVSLQREIAGCRKSAADIFRAESPERIVFTFNATDSLNLAIHGILRPGDHVITSTIEHNSVLRPLREAQDRRQVQVSYIGADRAGIVDPDRFHKAIRPETRLIALNHASNVTGAIQPIAEVGKIARDAGIPFLVDAAQTAGHVPIDLEELPADLLAAAGHKGLLGPLGTGLLYIRPGIERDLFPVRQGGTGTQSEEDRQPETLPDRYEPGNHNAPGLVGLAAGLKFLQEEGIEAIRAHERQCLERLIAGLSGIPELMLYGPLDPNRQVGVLSVGVPGYDPQTVATILDQNFGIEARAGLHCAPGAHRALGTFEDGGTIRLSVGPFTTLAEIDATVEAFGQIVSTVM